MSHELIIAIGCPLLILLFVARIKFDNWYYEKHGVVPEVEEWFWQWIIFLSVACLVAILVWGWAHCVWVSVVNLFT